MKNKISVISEQLLNALIDEDSAAVRHAINNGANINEVLIGNKTPLIMALDTGNEDSINFLMERGADSTSAMHDTAYFSQVEAMKILLAKGADINALDEDGNTPLFSALSTNLFGTLNFLLEQGAKTDVVNKKGKTVLELANNGFPQSAAIIENHLLQVAAINATAVDQELSSISKVRPRI